MREALFSILADQIEQATFLDLFAGSGAMGLEALSRGAKEAVFVENHREAIECIRKNIATLGANATLLPIDIKRAIEQLQRAHRHFTLIYVDPPYAIDIAPLLPSLASLLSHEGMLIIEQAKDSLLSHPSLNLADQRGYGASELFFFKLFDKKQKSP